MRGIISVILIGLAFLSVSCLSKPIPQVTSGFPQGVVGITIGEGGIETDSSEVVIRNFYPGARAEMTYSIRNGTKKAIMPEIFVVKEANVLNYSKAEGFENPSVSMFNWVKLPVVADVNPGETKNFIVALQIPKGEKVTANKIGFQIGVAGKTDAKVQPAVGIWWLVSMR